MAGVPGNIAWVLANKQTVKGTPAAATAVGGAFKMPLTGGNIGPTRNMDNLDETDSSRDQGVAYVSQTGVEGTPEFYVRDASIGFWLHKVLGADAVTGTTNFVHTITPANTLPYITAWRDIGDLLWEQYLDCKVGSMTISADAGAPLTASVGIMGRRPRVLPLHRTTPRQLRWTTARSTTTTTSRALSPSAAPSPR
jgi:hypothetical protein